ncbi:MAG TPA: hypothetical protein VFY36_05450 [Solirubrobacteraceae bacterium]|nr:hypothetical protein [Solirubrobacteraceae bacterium]
MIIVLFLFVVLEDVFKDLYIEARDRSDERIMAAYQRQEAARAHAENLAGIDRAVRATSDEMIRVAAEARDDVVEGTAVEVTRR